MNETKCLARRDEKIPALVTQKEAARVIGVTVVTLREWRLRGVLTPVVTTVPPLAKRRVFYKRADCEKLRDARAQCEQGKGEETK